MGSNHVNLLLELIPFTFPSQSLTALDEHLGYFIGDSNMAFQRKRKAIGICAKNINSKSLNWDRNGSSRAGVLMRREGKFCVLNVNRYFQLTEISRAKKVHRFNRGKFSRKYFVTSIICFQISIFTDKSARILEIENFPKNWKFPSAMFWFNVFEHGKYLFAVFFLCVHTPRWLHVTTNFRSHQKRKKTLNRRLAPSAISRERGHCLDLKARNYEWIIWLTDKLTNEWVQFSYFAFHIFERLSMLF